ncbi:LpqB family beta-propeller domain-containing protein [Micromonospora inyonensis]|uniref:Sporulation and spore germination n=1 Tax=Micromonospora inyonensis TaxID=47866 RepID=A0A1C6RQ69_9ACTN|nr:LpqB family beta-propeller domain-containing protein [Micromonospora inyonensis]SCL19300.1 Sporulation and spore germination [Micromonospora inyonensis]
MNRRLVAALLAGVLLAAGLGGCGIPQFSEVRVDGPGPVGEAGSVDGRPSEPPPRGASGSDSAAFIRNFLAAPAGEANRAYDRVLQFIAPEDRDRLQEKQGSDFAVNVVRLLDDPVTTVNPQGTTGEEATFSVRVTVQQVGLLRANGTLAPPVATETEYQFNLRAAAPAGSDDDDAGYYVVDPPSTLLLSDQALQMFYRPSTIYFWNSNQTRLVPDQRYLPLAVPKERRVTEVVGWLTDGPSEWLAPTVTRLPDGAQLINNATETDGRWEIDIAMSGEDGAKFDRLVTQLAWSLPDLDGPLELKVRNQTRRKVASAAQHRLANPVYPVRQDPQRFCVYEGVVRPLAFLGEISGTDPVAQADNRDVVSAGLSRAGDRILAALVVADGRRQRLAVGSGAAPVRVTARSAATYGSIGRPVWLKTPDTRGAHGLVVADGRLHRFDSAAHLTPVPLIVPGPVTAVAAALDGHRIALVVGGRLYVAAVSVDGGGVTVGPTRQVPTSLTALTAVDWAGESRLVLAGAQGQPAVYEVSVDGAGAEVALRTDLGAKVTHLASYPDNPVVPFARSPVMYEANRVTWAGPPLAQVLREQVQGIGPAGAEATPGSPTAPFFLY